MTGKTAKDAAWLNSIKECWDEIKDGQLLQRAKQYIISGKRSWDNCSPIVRHCLAVLGIVLAGVCAPSAEIGEYRICLCNLAIGMSLMLGLIGGPSYTVTIFIGLLFFNFFQGYTFLGGSYVFISALSALIICSVSALLRRFDIRSKISTSGGQLFLYLLEVLVLPVCVAGIVIFISLRIIL